MRGIAIGGAMHSVTGVPAGNATLPSSTGSVVMRLPSWFELSKRRTSSIAVLIMSGFSISRFFSPAFSASATRPVADQIGRGLVPGVEQEDAVVQQLLRRQPFAIVFALDSGASARRVRDAGLYAAALDQDFEIAQEILHRRVAASKGLGADHRLQRTRIASDQPRSGARSSCGTYEQVADHLDGMAGGEIADQLDVAILPSESSKLSTSRIRSGSISAIARGDNAPMIKRRTRVCAGGSLKTRLVV